MSLPAAVWKEAREKDLGAGGGAIVVLITPPPRILAPDTAALGGLKAAEGEGLEAFAFDQVPLG